MTRAAVRWTTLLVLVAAPACDWLTGPDSPYERPRETGDGWETASLHDVGMDPQPLLDLIALIDGTDDHLIHGILIVRRGRLVFEEYWPGVDLEVSSLNPVERDFDRDTRHSVMSVSKSLTAALAGIALDRGLLRGVDDSVFSYFPEYGALRTDANRGITLAHLLSFSSGYDWNEFVYEFGDPRDSHDQMFNAADPVAYLLARPVTTDPGTVFHYNSGDTNLLGEILRRVSQASSLVEFAEAFLFRPLGIDSYAWMRFPGAPTVTFASGGASLRPRDMAKLGALYLNGGTWKGQRILSATWVTASTTMAMPLGGNGSLYGYGYNWWLGRAPYAGRQVAYYLAAGWGGQYVFVLPELELIVVTTGGAHYESRPLNFTDLMEDYILRAVVE